MVSVLCLSCAKRELPGVPFERSVTWRASERLAVEQRQQPFRIGDGPTYRAVWTNGGVCLHYCLMGNGIFSMSGPWPLVVFSDDGRILEENEVIAGVDLEPRRLLSVSPLQVGFGYRGRLGPGLAETNGAHYSPQEWQSATQRVYTGYVEARRKWEAEERANQMPTQ